MGMSSMRDLLSGSTFQRPGVRRSISAAMIVEAANRIIPGYLTQTRNYDIVAISFKDGVIRLRAKSAAARHALRGVEQHILSKLQQDFPASSVKSITVTVSKEPSRYEFS